MKPYNGPLKDIETEAYVVHKPNAPFKLEKVVLDEIRPNEILVQMKYTGICHSDIVMQQDLVKSCTYPAIFGHEGAGHILALGSGIKDQSLKPGDAVLLSFNTCGKCAQCQKGHLAFCHIHPAFNLAGVRMDDRKASAKLADGRSVNAQFFGQSSFSRVSVVQERSVVKCEFPENMEIYAPMGCGYQTGAGTVLNALQPPPSSSIAIFGLGSVGLTALMAAKYLNVQQIIAIDIIDSKLQIAKELGATDTINSLGIPKDDLITKIKSLTPHQDGPNFAIDCTGIVSVVHNVIAVIAPAGTAALVGIMPRGAELKFDGPSFMLANKKLVGVVEGDSNPKEFIPRMVGMHREGKFPVDKLSRLYPAERIEDAIKDMHDGKVVKPVLQWW